MFSKLVGKITNIVAQWVSKVSRPELEIVDVDVKNIKAIIKNGDAICSRTNFELSNFFEKVLTGSFWGHVGIYFNGYVYEATTKGVRKVSLERFCLTKDALGVCRLHGSDWTPAQDADMRKFLNEQLGEGYDYSLDWGGTSKWYCSKLVYFAWSAGNANEDIAIQSINTLGLKKIIPENIWNSTVQIFKCGYNE